MGLLTKKHHGFTLVEATLSMALLLLLGIGAVAANRLATTSVTINQLRSKGNILAEEGMEALMSVRAGDFLSMSPGTFHPVFDGAKWTLVSGAETLGVFTRSIVISQAMRELICFAAVCDIVDEGGINDEGTLKASINVSWPQQGETKQIILSSIITYWR